MFHLWFHLWFCITGSLGSLSALCPVWGVQDSLACAQKWRGGGGRGAEDWEKRGWEQYGKREKRGREAGFPR